MISYTKGNLLEAQVEALVNTVNTVGVMGKGIALMFKERFPKNMEEYARACKSNQVATGKMFVTETDELIGPRWIVNFPTKQHWRSNSRIEWIQEGLEDLRRFIIENEVKSIAIPPLGAGNGGLEWKLVKPLVESELSDLRNVDIVVFEPTAKYQNVAKKRGLKELTPARALIVELIRRYWVLGIECSLLEIQKLAWFMVRVTDRRDLDNVLKLKFDAGNYGPYANNLMKLLDRLDGSYLKSEKRIPDCGPLDVIWFNDELKDRVELYFKSDASDWKPALEEAARIIEGFESPFGMELLSTVDWLITRQNCAPTLEGIKAGLREWPAGEYWAVRKERLFKDSNLEVALRQLDGFSY